MNSPTQVGEGACGGKFPPKGGDGGGLPWSGWLFPKIAKGLGGLEAERRGSAASSWGPEKQDEKQLQIDDNIIILLFAKTITTNALFLNKKINKIINWCFNFF